jgi:molybdenum cofactor biosynthesis enzyme MoaA
MSDGNLRTCLGREHEISLHEALVEGKEPLKRIIRQEILDKPACHLFDTEALEKRNMSRIGG